MGVKAWLLCWFWVGLSGVNLAQQGCELKKDEEGIKIYLCETEGSSFKTIKVALEVQGSLRSYAAGILAVENYHLWQNSISNISILKRISSHELIYYSEVDAPWPLAHRDLIFHLKLSQDSLSRQLRVTLQQMPDYIPEKPGIVRIPEASSELRVTPLEGNRLKVAYTIHVNPGGHIPAFIVNVFAAETPWHTYYNFRQLLESGTFDNLPVVGIKN